MKQMVNKLTTVIFSRPLQTIVPAIFIVIVLLCDEFVQNDDTVIYAIQLSLLKKLLGFQHLHFDYHFFRNNTF